MNPAFCSFLSFTPEELRQKHCVDFSPPEDAAKDWTLFQQLRGGSINHYQMEKRYFRRDGSLVWGRLSVPLLNGRSSPLVIGVVEDITNKKMAGEAARSSEERLRLAQRVARIGTLERDVRTGKVTWTAELEVLYGLKPGGFNDTTTDFFKNLVHPEDWAKVSDAIDRALKTGEPTQEEWRVVWPDGSIHWIAGRWQVAIDDSGQPSRIIGVNIDATQRKSAEEKLREYERAVESVDDMIVVVDREYRYLMANRQYLKMRNITREQVLGRLVHEFVGMHDFETLVKPMLDECFQGKVVKHESKYVRPGDGERDLSISYFPIEGARGIDRVACILQDITDRKRAQQALADVSRTLMEAQEQERSRIGRELHDDINQRLPFAQWNWDNCSRIHPTSWAECNTYAGR